MEFKFIDLIKYYFKNILSNTILFIVVFVSGLIYIGYIYTTEYVANSTFMIGACFHNCEQEAHLNVDFNKKVLFDYMELITSTPVLKKANENANLEYSVGELKKMVSTSYEEDTEYIKITVVSKSQRDSANIAYNIFGALESEIEKIFDVKNIHLVEADSFGHEKTSKKKLILYIFVISVLATVIKTIIQFLFFPRKDKNQNLEDNISNLNKSKAKKRTKRKKNTSKLLAVSTKKSTSTKVVKGKTTPAKKSTSTKVVKGKTTPTKKSTNTKVVKGKTTSTKKSTNTKVVKGKTTSTKKASATKNSRSNK